MFSFKIKRVFFSNILSKFSTIIIQLFLVPLFIYYWGKEQYGVWLMLSTIPTYLQASDFGLSVTVTTSICGLIANKKEAEALELYRSANYAFGIISFILILMYFISIFTVNWQLILPKSNIDNYTFNLTIFFLLGSSIISFFLGLLLGIYRSEGRFDISQNLMTVLQIVEGISILMNLILRGNFISVTITLLMIRFLLSISIIIHLNKSYSWFNFGFNRNLKAIFSLLSTSVSYMIIVLGQSLILQGTTFIIGSKLGAIPLVTFNTIRTLTNSIKSFSSAFYFSFLPEFTVLVARKENTIAKKLFHKIFIITFIITLVFIIVYYFFGNIIVKYWTHGAVEVNLDFYSIMLLGSFFSTLNNCSYIVLNATNQNQKTGFFYTLFGVITCLLIYHFAHKGLFSVAFFLTLFEVAILGIVLKETYRVLNTNVNFH